TEWSGNLPDPVKRPTPSRAAEEHSHAPVVGAIAWPVLAIAFLSLFVWGVSHVPDVQLPELVFPLLNAAEPFSVVRLEPSPAVRFSPASAGTLIPGFLLLLVGHTAARRSATT
ncbi:hypothetical protein D9C01_12235, partial [Corynebacterium diphtheriae]